MTKFAVLYRAIKTGCFLKLFWGNSIRFPTVAASIYIPTNGAQGFPFSTSSLTLVISCPWMITILTDMSWYFIMVSICISQIIINIDYLFIYLLLFVCLLWEKKNVYFLYHFLIKMFGLLLLNFMNSLHFVDVNSLSGMWFSNIFSCSIGCLFILSVFLSSAVQKLLVWCNHTCLFLLLLLVLLVIFKISLQYQNNGVFPHMFYGFGFCLII